MRFVNTVGWFRRVGQLLMRIPRPVCWVPAVSWMALIWWASSISPRSAPRPDAWRLVVHNFLHAPEFGVLAICARLFLPRVNGWPVLHWGTRLGVVLFTTAYGVIDEFHQAQTPNRDFSVLDILSDCNAACCVVWIAGYVGRTDATERGLAVRFGLGIAACFVCAAIATFTPRLFPGVDWL